VHTYGGQFTAVRQKIDRWISVDLTIPDDIILLLLQYVLKALMQIVHKLKRRLIRRITGQPRRSKYLRLGAGNVHYDICGRHKPGIPILVVHGGPATSHYYLRPLKDLASDRAVIFYDQLGCGRSDRPKNKSRWNIEYYTEELDEVRKALKLDTLHILGHSWGSMVAVDYMLTRRPEGIKSVILSSPSLSLPLWQSDCRHLIAQMKERDRKTIMKCEESGRFNAPSYKLATLAFYGKHLCRARPWPACLIRSIMNMGTDIYADMWGPSEFTVTGTLKGYDRCNRLKDIKVPTLYTCGRYDEAAPGSVEHYHKRTSVSEFVVFEDASHLHHIEKPQLYVDTVRSFISRVENKAN
jgi:proline iminopeptidase